jgi:hypothetical protein
MTPHADSVQQPSETFAAWLSREMPAGTVISDPAWWAPRIERAIARFGTRPAAEPINPLSLREAYRPNALDQEWTEHHSRNYPQKAATIINAARQLLLAAEPNQSGSAGEAELPSPYNIINGVWYYSAEQMRAALSRQAPAAPAGADFEREVEDWEASQPFYDLAWKHGASQHLSFDGDELESLTFSAKDFENFCVALTPAAPTQALLGWTRYEKARKLNPAQWAELHQRNLRGETFDDMIDALPATTQPVQQDTDPCKEDWDRYLSTLDGAPLPDPYNGFRAGWHFAARRLATPPAEKQAAPSGEDKPKCRDCADFGPICPNSGRPCATPAPQDTKGAES